MSFKEKINGKKRFIVVPLAGLLILGGTALKVGKAVGEKSRQIETNTAEIVVLKETPAQIAVVEQKIEAVDAKVEIIRQQQMITQNDIKEILRAVR